MDQEFDKQKAKEFLARRELEKEKKNEKDRLDLLNNIKGVLEKEFSGSKVEVYLVGSIIKPHSFNETSDIDIVLKNFKGDRFDLWTKIESEVNRNIEIIIYENCSFKDHVVSQGMRVV